MVFLCIIHSKSSLSRQNSFFSSLGKPELADLKSGLTVGVVVIPQAMAYATLAGLPPQHGLYAAFVPVLLYGLFGSSRYLSIGPAALDSMLVAAFLVTLELPSLSAYVQAAILLTLLVGSLQFLLGLLKLGVLVQFLSKPVISGFTMAAVLLIGVSQLAPFLGLKDLTSPFAALKNSFNVIVMTSSIGIGSLVLLLLGKRLLPKIPIELLVVILATLTTVSLKWAELGVAEVGSIPSGLPSFNGYLIDLYLIKELIPFAVALAILGFLSSMTIVKASESKTGIVESNPNKELRALGLANIVGALFQSYVASASFSRSSILMGSGSKSRWAVLFSAALVGLSLFVLTPLLEHIPMAVLSAIVLFSLIQLLSFNYPIKLWKQSRAEFLVLLCTFVLTLFVGIIQGLVLGILVSLIVWISRSVKPHYAVLGKIRNTHYYKNINRFSQDIDQDERLLLFRFDAPIFFANKDYFNQMLMDEIDKKGESLQEIVLISRGISYLDSSSIELLHHILKRLRQRGLGFSVAGAIGPTRDAMRRSGLMERIGGHRFFSKTADAVSFLNGEIDATEHSENIATQTNKQKV